MASSVYAADAGSGEFQVGLIDLNRVFNAHPNSQKLLELEENLMSELQKRQEELNEKGKGKTREEVQQLEAEMNAEWAPVRDQMLQQRTELVNQRYQDVIEAIRLVAESQGLGLVIRSELRLPVGESQLMEMPLVLYGGIDITDQVVEAIGRLTAE